MNRGVVLQEALRQLRRLEPEPRAERAVVAALEAAVTGPLNWMYEAVLEGGLPATTARTRAAAVLLLFAAGNLADDLADGDCDYLEAPLREGPAVQYLLHNLAVATLTTELPADVLGCVTLDLAGAATMQPAELHAATWDADLTMRVAHALGGLQYRAYAQVAWFGSPFASRAAETGERLGCVGFVAEDVRSRDRRYWSLPDRDRKSVRDWALGMCATLREERIQVVDRALDWAEGILAKVGE